MKNEIVKEWLKKADEDFGFASTSIENTDFFAQICFNFQQAAEKYLKAFIIANKLDFRPVHNLLELLEICKKKPRFRNKRKQFSIGDLTDQAQKAEGKPDDSRKNGIYHQP